MKITELKKRRILLDQSDHPFRPTRRPLSELHETEGLVHVPDKPGCGFTLDEDRLKALERA